MYPQCAGYGYETVADQSVTEGSARRPERRCDREALNVLGQGDRRTEVRVLLGEPVPSPPVLVEYVAVAQIGYPGAAQLAQPGQRRGIRRLVADHFEPVAAPLERDAKMRCTQEY